MRWLQLCSSLSIHWDCLSLGWEWKLTFTSAIATAEFSKFAGILSAALSQHLLLGFEIAQLEFHHLHPLVLFTVILPKAHLTSHSRMSGFRWVITPLWISGSLRSFMYHSSLAAAAAKLLQSCPTLCDPIVSSPPGSPVPGILQARILELGCHFLL